MKPPPQHRCPRQTTLFAVVVFYLSIALSTSLATPGYSLVSLVDNQAPQCTQETLSTHRNLLPSNTRNNIGPETHADAVYHASAPAQSAGSDNMPACIVAVDDFNDDNDEAIADDSSAPDQGPLSNYAAIAHNNGMREITHPARTWFPAVFSGVYQSGAAPPARGATENCQKTWHGGNWLGGETAVTLRIIGGELTPEIGGISGMGMNCQPARLNFPRFCAQPAIVACRMSSSPASAIQIFGQSPS